MKADPRIVLAADEPMFVHEVQDHLRHASLPSAHAGSYQEIAEQLTHDSDGVLLMGVSDADEQRHATALIQQIILQKWPAVVVVLDARIDQATNGHPHLGPLDIYAARRLRWPTEAELLTPMVKGLDRSRAFRFAHSECLVEVLSRRLLALTPSLLPLADRIALAGRHDVTVLLNGETGTGKTYLARLIHEHSARREHRMLIIPCGAISTNLIESEFFGHVKGAFTGADRAKIGKFAAVGQGTLLLDEIDTLALEHQATLLRVIETGEFEPVGGNETEHCKARLIVASNIDLEKAVALGKFRADLYFRLNVMSFHLPALRERVMDIEPLARGMAIRFARKFKKELFDIHAEAVQLLESFAWPGNLRQLENVVQQAVLVCDGPELLARHLPAVLREPAIVEAEINGHSVPDDTLHQQRDIAERGVIQRALMTNGYNRTRAADALGISRVTLYKKMRKYGLLKEPLRV